MTDKNKRSKIAAFRCEGSANIGTGHIMRCLTLAYALSDQNYEIRFVSALEATKNLDILKKSGFKVESPDAESEYDLLVVDSYDLDAVYEKSARSKAKKILVIDDLANRPHDCDILIDPTHGRKSSDYKSLVPADCNILTGGKYALIRPEFRQLTYTGAHDFRKAHKVLVSTGGTNVKQSTEFILRSLAQYTERSLQIDVVTGVNAHGIQSIESAIDTVNKNGKHRAKLHVNTQEMPALMTAADLCIGAGGTTSWERCCSKLPAITLELADNQQKILDTLHKSGAVINLGPIENLKEETLLNEFKNLIGNPQKLKEMSQKAFEICDGRGISRIKCHLLSADKTITIRLAEEEDCKMLFDWQNIKGIRQYSRNPNPPVWEDHLPWFANAIANPGIELFIISDNGKPRGMLRLNKKADWQKKLKTTQEVLEVSVLIIPEAQAGGLAQAGLQYIHAYKPRARILAEIHPENQSSVHLFRKMGYNNLEQNWYIYPAENV